MKIRLGFVANSSSSSFVVSSTGTIFSGRDLCLRDCDLKSCERDHIFDASAELERSDDALEAVIARKITEVEGRAITEWYTEQNRQEELSQLKMIMDWDEYLSWDEEADYYAVPKELCPICQMENASIWDVYKYAFKKLGMSWEEVKQEMMNAYPTYEDLKKDLDGVKTIIPQDG